LRKSKLAVKSFLKGLPSPPLSCLCRAFHWNCLQPSSSVAAKLGMKGKEIPVAIAAAAKKWKYDHAGAMALTSGGLRAMFRRMVGLGDRHQFI
jgi:hypothetical protein